VEQRRHVRIHADRGDAARGAGRERAVFIGARALLAAVLAAGCAEPQFALRVRDQRPIEVSSPTEPVQRAAAEPATAPGGAAAPFADRGVILTGGGVFPYFRDGDWIGSVEPIAAAVERDRVRVAFTLHPGRRDLPLVLTTSTDNVCDLRLRTRSDRALGYAGLVVGATAALFVPFLATSRDPWTRVAAPYVGAAAGVLLLGGAGLLLWPATNSKTLVEGACR